ncbi:hypothetical protein [Parasitella parasitica]|uniref:Uncharacterized protein n=1 Tax=Parasitella parasitica TaxID=35722 RepID=A0A0B7NC46_9FUNG|nr:hypothetical protein [Parasitella parasitica]
MWKDYDSSTTAPVGNDFPWSGPAIASMAYGVCPVCAVAVRRLHRGAKKDLLSARAAGIADAAKKAPVVRATFEAVKRAQEACDTHAAAAAATSKEEGVGRTSVAAALADRTYRPSVRSQPFLSSAAAPPGLLCADAGPVVFAAPFLVLSPLAAAKVVSGLFGGSLLEKSRPSVVAPVSASPPAPPLDLLPLAETTVVSGSSCFNSASKSGVEIAQPEGSVGAAPPPVVAASELAATSN